MADEHSTLPQGPSLRDLKGTVFTIKPNLRDVDYVDAVNERLAFCHAFATAMATEDFHYLEADLQKSCASGLSALLQEAMSIHEYFCVMTAQGEGLRG